MSKKKKGGGMNIKTSKGMGIKTKQTGPTVYDQMKEITKWDIKRGPKRKPVPKQVKEQPKEEPKVEVEKPKTPKQKAVDSIGSLVRSYKVFKDSFLDA